MWYNNQHNMFTPFTFISQVVHFPYTRMCHANMQRMDCDTCVEIKNGMTEHSFMEWFYAGRDIPKSAYNEELINVCGAK